MNITVFDRTALVAVALLLAGCHHEKDGVAVNETTTVQLHVAHASTVTDEVIASGAIEAMEKAEVAFMVPGRVISVDVNEGTLVCPGQILARLDPGDYEKNVAIAEAQLQEVKARHARLTRLHEAGSLTDTDFDKIVAGLQQAEAAAALARRQLGYTELRAPFQGWVVKHGIAAGLVATPAVPVFTVISPGAVWANLGVSEADITKVRIGQTVAVQVTANSQNSEVGRVDAILPNADLLSRSFTIKVQLPNERRELRHGNVVVGRISTGEKRQVIAIPPQVVQKHPDGSLFVWLIDPARHTAIRQIVQVGALRATEVEITSGVREGDQIVLNVPHTLFEGAHLAVANQP